MVLFSVRKLLGKRESNMQVCELGLTCQFISVELAAERLKRRVLKKCLICLMSKIIYSLSRKSMEWNNLLIMEKNQSM